MKRSSTRLLFMLLGLLMSSSAKSQAGLNFFPNDPSGWALAVANAGHTVETFDTGPANIALSNEVDFPASAGDGLGTSILTFDKANTCLSGSFTFATQDVLQIFVYREPLLVGDLFPFDQSDAIEMKAIDGSSVYAMALDIYYLELETGTVEVFSGETSLGSTSDLARHPESFLGIVSDEPFTRITYSGTENGNESFADFQFAFVPQASSIPGNFNHDKSVDGIDLSIWEMSFGADAGADADCDDDSDGNDFLIWQQNFGMSLGGPGVVGVPEPAAVVLFLAGMLSLIGAGRCGQKRFS